MWIWIGVVAMSAAGLALFRLSGNVTRIVVGVALVICLGMVAVMFWLDGRAERETKRLVDRR
jgi:lipopolysaccharide export LptBFGC system permease protein LptF